MEAHVVKAEGAVDESGEDVLARVVLHPSEALLRVHDALHRLPDGQRRVGMVADLPSPLVHVQHARAAEGPGVGELPAALREKGRAVQHDAVPRLLFAAVEHDGVKAEEVAVLIVELFGHGVFSFCVIDMT